MKPLRIGIDMDGVMADFIAAFSVAASIMFKRPISTTWKDWDMSRATGLSREELERVWQYIDHYQGWWAALPPVHKNLPYFKALQSLQERRLAQLHFITVRRDTGLGVKSVYEQTYDWLSWYGFEKPNVFVTHANGGKGLIAQALELDYHYDDCWDYCRHVKIARPATDVLLQLEPHNERFAADAEALHIHPVHSLGDFVDALQRFFL